MLVAASVFGGLAYKITRDQEEQTAIHTYESIAASALEQAQAITRRKQQGAQSLTTMWSFAFPDADQWPLVGFRGFTRLANEIAALSSSAGHGFMAIVKPNEVEEFEAHAKALYQEYEYPDSAGWSDFGFGIYGMNASAGYEDSKFHDISGETAWNSKYNIMAPFLQHKNTFNNPSLLLRNLHQFELRGRVLEDIIDCGKAADQNATTSPTCTTVTGFTEIFVRPGPSAVFFNPIFPANDPTEVVGFIGTSMNWAEVLTNVVPDYVDGLDCVISDGLDSFTYVIREGVPVLLGEGDQHDPKFDSYGDSITLNEDTSVVESAIYTLSLYPSETIFNEFRSDIPRHAAILFVSVTVACTLLFFLYDYFMQHESHQQKKILDMKRRFVRFISHEIRTPLNVVCMGLDLLQTDIKERQEHSKLLPVREENGAEDSDSSPKSDEALKSSELLGLTEEIRENSQNAISVLNDLLNYDKVESGTFKLALGRVDICSTIQKTVKEFAIQATNKKISLDLRMKKEGGDYCDLVESLHEPLRDAHVIGDERRLAQVIRNLISNALKFTPENENVSITVSHLPDGLPDCDPLDTLRVQDKEQTESNIEELIHNSIPNGALEIIVQDKGVGLSKRQLGQLFSEGVQFNPNVLQHGGGSGLGLCITKEIVEMHSGSIGAMSDGLGFGTKFSVRIPLYQSQHATAHPTVTDSASERTYTEEHLVLVVDDVLTNTKMLVRLLEKAGHQCVTAANGDEAIKAYEVNLKALKDGETTQQFDTILMDFEMPVMNGPEATQQLRELGYSACIFGVTGNVLAEDVATFKASGADNVLYKPINLQAIEAAWENLDSSRRR